MVLVWDNVGGFCRRCFPLSGRWFWFQTAVPFMRTDEQAAAKEQCLVWAESVS